MAKSKGTAYFLSFLLAGLGQMYLGNFTRGALILISGLIIGFASFAALNYFGLIPSLIFYIWQISDAGKEYEKREYSPIEKREYSPIYGNIICTNCDSTNVSSSEYCTKCGYKIQLICPTCKNLNKSGVSFCGKCGTKL